MSRCTKLAVLVLWVALLISGARPSHAQSASVTLESGGGVPGEVFTVAVEMTTDTAIAGFQFAFHDSLNVVDVDTIIAGTRVANAGMSLNFNRVSSLTTNVLAFAFTSSTVSPGSGPIAHISLKVRPDAFSGTHLISLKSVVLSDDRSVAIPVTVTDATVTVSGGVERDAIPPVAPTGLTAEAGDQQVSLNWNPGSENDLSRYVIFRASGITAVLGDSVGSVLPTESGYLDQNLPNNSIVSYRIIAVDLSGNRSDPSEVVSATPVDPIPPSEPTGLIAEAGDQQVSLNWNPGSEIDLSHYAIYRAPGVTTVLGDSIGRVLPPESAYLDQNLPNDSIVSYRIIAVDFSGNRSGPSEVVSATPVDMTPPQRPVGLHTTAGDRRVTLSWLPNTEVDVAGYVVFRGLTAASTDSIGDVPVTTTSFADTGLTNGVRYFYQLAAIDERGNRGSLSVSSDATPEADPDTTAPEVPALLVATGRDSQIALRWEPVSDEDLSHYILYRSTQNGFSPSSQDSVARLAHFQIAYLDNNLPNGIRYHYRLTAVDFSGNSSAPSDQVSAIPDIVPAVRGVDPILGPIAGGTSVVIRGDNFQDGATVTVGGIEADSIVFIDSHSVSSLVPPNGIGRKDVSVTNPSGISGTLRRGFLYVKVDSVRVVVKVSSVVDGGARVDTVHTGTVPAGLPYIVPTQIVAPLTVMQPLYNALAGMSLEIPSAAIVAGMTVCLNIDQVTIRGDSTVFAGVHGVPSFLSISPTVSVRGFERPPSTFSSLAALRLTIRLNAFNRILQTSGVDSTQADSLALAYVTDQGLSQEGMISRVQINERRLIGSLTRLAPLAGVRQRDVTRNDRPAVIVGGPFAAPSDTSALITWRTDKLTTSRVYYGTSALTLSQTVGDSVFVTGHALVLPDLSQQTRYHYRVVSSDGLGQETQSRLRTFQTGNRPDVIPPTFVVAPQVLSVSRHGAVLGWTTDERSVGTVEFGSNSSLGSLLHRSRFEYRHVVAVTGLQPDQIYHTLISSRDQEGNVTVYSDTVAFTTLAKPDTLSPRIVRRPFVSGLTPSTGIIQWRTDEPGNSVVFYRRVATGDTLKTSNPEEYLVLEHNVNLTGLAPDTPYNYAVVSTDASGNKGRSVARRFRTPSVADTVPPVIVRGPNLLYRSDRGVAFGWRTNEVSDGFAYYRGGPDSTFIPRGSERPTRRHFVFVGGLEPGTDYTFAFSSTDPSGNTVVFPGDALVSKPTGTFIRPRILTVTNSMLTITTSDVPDSEAPVIVNGPNVVALSSNSLSLAWVTDEPSDSRVQYGPNLALTANSEDVVTSHLVTLTNLEPGTPYDFQVGSTDAGGNGPNFSTTGTASTSTIPDAEPPVIVPGSFATAASNDRITVTWETDEPSDSFVEYGVAPGELHGMEEEPDLVTYHSVVITNLQSQTLHYLRAHSVDLSENGPAATPTVAIFTSDVPDTSRPVISDVTRHALATTDSTVVLSIGWVTDILADGRVEYGTTTALGNVVVEAISGLRHSLDVSRLALNTKYFYRVGSTNTNDPQNQRIAYSALDSLVTPAFADTTRPSSPVDVAAVPGSGSVRVRWSASPSGNVTGYRVNRNATTIATVGPFTEYLDVSAVNGQTYTYVIQAISALGTGSLTTVGISVTPDVDQVPTAPSNGSPAAGDTVSLAPYLIVNNAVPVLGDSARAVLTYDFQVADNINFTSLTATISGIPGGSPGNPTNWQIRDSGREDTDLLQDGTTYWWRVRAHDSEFSGDWSPSTSFVASSGVPTGISLSSFVVTEARGTVTLDWTVDGGHLTDGFHVLRSVEESGGFARISGDAVLDHASVYVFTDHDIQVNRIYYYQLEAVTSGESFGPISIKVTPPHEFTLTQNFPNPFNPATTIRYELPEQANVVLKVYNMLGQEVVILVNETQQAGYHTILWNGQSSAGHSVASGLYIYRLEAGAFARARKMLLIK
jgi:fibronectin type 3 domain-containing protein